MDRKKHARFRLPEEILDAIEKARGKSSTVAYIRNALILQLAIDGYTVEIRRQIKCLSCGNMFAPVRITARYCCVNCRMREIQRKNRRMLREHKEQLKVVQP